MKQTIGLLKNKTYTLASFKEILRLKTNQFKPPNQSYSFSIQNRLIEESNSLLLNSQNNSKVSTDVSIEMQSTSSSFSVEWAQHYYNTLENIRQIKNIIIELQILGTKRLKMQFGDTKQIEQQIYENNQKATTKIIECEKNTQKILEYQNKLESQSEKRIRENIYTSLNQQIVDLTQQLRNQQKRMITMIICIDQNDNKIFLNQNQEKNFNSKLTYQEEQIYAQILEEKDQEIDRLVQMTNQLAQVFQSLNQLVLDQGHLLDRIDFNLDQSHNSIRKANLELKDAEKIQKSTSSNRCINLLLILNVICFLLLIIKYSN